MLTVISPAKTLDFETPPGTRKATQPQFLARAAELVEDARALSPDEIRVLMGVSANIAELNHQRFMDWGLPFSLDNAKQALLAFKGDVYVGLQAETLSAAQLEFRPTTPAHCLRLIWPAAPAGSDAAVSSGDGPGICQSRRQEPV